MGLPTIYVAISPDLIRELELESQLARLEGIARVERNIDSRLMNGGGHNRLGDLGGLDHLPQLAVVDPEEVLLGFTFPAVVGAV